MKKISIYVSLAALGLLVSGCNSFLDKNPDNRSEINDKTKIDALLVMAYPDRTNMSLLTPRCDYIQDFGTTFKGSQPGSTFDYVISGFMWDQYTRTESSNDTYEQFWTATYKAIAATNQALASVKELGDTKELAASKSEALVCRAYNHFTLLSMFSNMFDPQKSTNPGIPYVDEPENIVIKNYDRKTVTYTLSRIREDFEAGIKSIGGASDYKQPKFHFTREAANAFGARFSLYTEDYAGVLRYANALIPAVQAASLKPVPGVVNKDGSPALYVDANDMASLFCAANMHDWNKLASNPGGADGIGLAFSGAVSANLLVSECVTGITRSTAGTYYARHGILKSELDRMRTTSPSGVREMKMVAYGFSGDPTIFLPKFYEDFKIESSAGGLTYGTAYAKIPLLRIEEVLLARAEAYAMTGDYQNAMNDLNIWTKVRATKGAYSYNSNTIYKDRLIAYYAKYLDDAESFINNEFNVTKFTATGDDLLLQKALIMAILDARNLEFLLEGVRYFDILRWNIPVTHVTADRKKSTLTPDDDRRVIQVPQVVSLSGVESNRWQNIGTWE